MTGYERYNPFDKKKTGFCENGTANENIEKTD